MTEPATPAEETEETPDGPAESDKPGAEAAKYRVKLRETETERDALAARVEKLQRTHIERLVTNRLAQPEDLFAFGLGMGDLLTDGEVDDALVEAAVAGLLEKRPGLAKGARIPYPDTGQGRRGSVAGSTSWADLLHPR